MLDLSTSERPPPLPLEEAALEVAWVRIKTTTTKHRARLVATLEEAALEVAWVRIKTTTKHRARLVEEAALEVAWVRVKTTTKHRARLRLLFMHINNYNYNYNNKNTTTTTTSNNNSSSVFLLPSYLGVVDNEADHRQQHPHHHPHLDARGVDGQEGPQTHQVLRAQHLLARRQQPLTRDEEEEKEVDESGNRITLLKESVLRFRGALISGYVQLLTTVGDSVCTYL